VITHQDLGLMEILSQGDLKWPWIHSCVYISQAYAIQSNSMNFPWISYEIRWYQSYSIVSTDDTTIWWNIPILVAEIPMKSPIYHFLIFLIMLTHHLFVGSPISVISGGPVGKPRRWAMNKMTCLMNLFGARLLNLPSGNHTKNYGTSPFLMGKSTINGHFQ